MNYEELLVSNLTLVDKLIAFVCRRNALSGADAEDFASLVKLKLVENDYAILSRFEEKSRLSTYLSVVVQRLFLDFRSRLWGRWKPTAQATRAGAAAVLFEAAVHRDGLPPDEALRRVLERYPDTPQETIRTLLDRPSRLPTRHRVYSSTDHPPEVASTHMPDRDLAQKEREAIGARASRVLRTAMQQWPPQDQLIVRMRYADGLKISSIARLMQLDQKALYKHLERLLWSLRQALAADGLPLAALRDLLESGPAVIDFDFEELAAGEYSLHEHTKEKRDEAPSAVGEGELA